jgi:hypothetical protein
MMPETVAPLQIAKLELREGDILVVKMPYPRMTQTHMKKLSEDLQRFVGKSIKIMILDANSELTVVRREDIAITRALKAPPETQGDDWTKGKLCRMPDCQNLCAPMSTTCAEHSAAR